jgi:hypothetical protein
LVEVMARPRGALEYSLHHERLAQRHGQARPLFRAGKLRGRRPLPLHLLGQAGWGVLVAQNLRKAWKYPEPVEEKELLPLPQLWGLKAQRPPL